MVIKESKVNLTILERCQCLGINRSSYYKWLNNHDKQEVNDNCATKMLIWYCYHKHKGTYGKPRILLWLLRMGLKINHKRVHKLMKELGLKAIIRKKWTSRKYKKENVYNNILEQNFVADQPKQKYVTDVTQLKQINNKKYYLCPIIDLYNNEVVSYKIHYRNDNELVQATIMSIEKGDDKLILHSDQGSQFTSHMYTKILTEKQITISMSKVGCCYDNASAESFFSHFKEEFYIFFQPKTEEELYKNIDDFILYYNTDRIQTKLKTSPVKYRAG